MGREQKDDSRDGYILGEWGSSISWYGPCRYHVYIINEIVMNNKYKSVQPGHVFQGGLYHLALDGIRLIVARPRFLSHLRLS